MPDDATTTFKVYSADSHLNEPPEIYERLPKQFRHRAPRIEIREGKGFHISEGQPPRPL